MMSAPPAMASKASFSFMGLMSSFNFASLLMRIVDAFKSFALGGSFKSHINRRLERTL
jgi:hypothetical protein